MSDPYTFPAAVGGVALLIGLVSFFKDFLPMWMEHRKSMKQSIQYEAKKHPKSEWRQFTQEEKDELDDFLTPYRFPEAIKLDEHEKALA